jgi:uncharacterized Ntn-hydrolase superfamily protein
MLRFFDLYDLCFGPTLKKIKKVDAHTAKEIQKMLSELGFYSGSSSGKLDESTRQALTDFHNMENLEMRFTNEPRTIDEEVLKSMRRRCQR